MRSFNKALISTVSVIAVSILLSFFTVEALMNSEHYLCCDNENRKNLAEKIDCLIIGASEGEYGFNTHIIDDEFGCFCYNFCGPGMDLKARYYLLKQELEHYSVNTVVYSTGKDALSKHLDEFNSSLCTIPRFYEFSDRVSYMFSSASDNDFESLLGTYMKDGFYVLSSKLIGDNSVLGTENKNHEKENAEKGYFRPETNNITLSENEILNEYSKYEITDKYFSENDEYFRKIIDLCKQNGIRFIVAVPTNSDAQIWIYNYWNKFHNYLNNITSETDTEYYNFDLLKSRYEDFSDEKSFFDPTHLSGEGSDTFSHLFCDTLKKVDAGEDVSDLFYSSYEEMKEDSPYMEYYKAHCGE